VTSRPRFRFRAELSNSSSWSESCLRPMAAQTTATPLRLHLQESVVPASLPAGTEAGATLPNAAAMHKVHGRDAWVTVAHLVPISVAQACLPPARRPALPQRGTTLAHDGVAGSAGLDVAGGVSAHRRDCVRPAR
jgi:hypothetical protein